MRVRVIVSALRGSACAFQAPCQLASGRGGYNHCMALLRMLLEEHRRGLNIARAERIFWIAVGILAAISVSAWLGELFAPALPHGWGPVNV